VSYLFDPFTYEFMQRALAESVLMSVACGLLGTLIVLRGLTFTGESLSHTLLPGAAIAVALGFAVVAGALAAGLLAALLIAVLLRRPEIGEDAVISVVFTGAFAAGVIVLSTHGTPKDLDSLLFGSILAVEPGDLWIGLGTTLGVAAVVGLARRGFVLVAFDRAFASAAGFRPALLDVVLLASLAGALTVALRGVGTLLVLALLVAPAAMARVLARRVWTMLWLAPSIGIASSFVGLEISYHAGAAAGAAICLTALAGLVVAIAYASLREWKMKARNRHSRVSHAGRFPRYPQKRGKRGRRPPGELIV
jgi:ABC-type Mn2+/Zn2+ transport system permease subunit